MELFKSIFDNFFGRSDFNFGGHQLDMTIDPCINDTHCNPESIRLFAREVINSVLGDAGISFEGNIDVECRDKAASNLIDALKTNGVVVSSSDIFHEQDMGGLTSYTAKVIKEAVNNARLHGRIDNQTFESLMTLVKKACYCG